jgi:hypothetical protein
MGRLEGDCGDSDGFSEIQALRQPIIGRAFSYASFTGIIAPAAGYCRLQHHNNQILPA